MRKVYWFTAAAVAVTMLAGAGWTILTWPAGATKAVGASVQIDPLQAMKNAKNLPATQYDDYSVVFK